MIQKSEKLRLEPLQETPEAVAEAQAQAALLSTPVDARWCHDAREALQGIRKRSLDVDATVRGVRLLAKVTIDENKCRYYHLDYRARAMLVAGKALPWGA